MGFIAGGPQGLDEDERCSRDDTHIGTSGLSKGKATAMPPPPINRSNTLSSLGRGQPSARPSAAFTRIVAAPMPGANLKQSMLPFGGPPTAHRTVGFPPGRTFVSQKSSLPAIEGSPVKGGPSEAGPSRLVEDHDVSPTAPAMDKGKARVTDEGAPENHIEPMNLSSALSDDEESGGADFSLSMVLGGQPKPEYWKNASRRASMASQFLHETIVAGLPGTPPRRGRTSTEGSDSSPTERARSLRSGGMRSEPSVSSKPRTALKVLKTCTVFVDVRTDDGDDAGGLFVDMLKNLGAKVHGRIGPSCTHIIFKNGQLSTLTRYRFV
jgi:hypothetical protein